MATFNLDGGGYNSEPLHVRRRQYGEREPMESQGAPMGGGYDSPGQPIPQAPQQPAQPAQTAPQSYGNTTYDQIAQLYRQFSNGAYNPTQQDVSQWGTNVDSRYMNQIGNSINAWVQQWQRQQPQQQAAPPQQPQQPQNGGPQNGDYRSWFLGLTNGRAPTPNELVALAPELQRYGVTLAPNARGVNGKIRLPDGRIIDVIQAADAGGKAWQWLDGPGGGANPFDDPATQGYIDQLNALNARLNQPQANPELDRLLQYMQTYFEQLQNPVYTDAQRDVINTQTIDPLERQRTARKQQVLQAMAARGMGPSDGPTIAAMQDVDRSFDQMRTSAQGQFAANEIGLGRQNQQQAVNVGSQAAQLRNGQFQQDEARALQGLGLARQVPDLAQSRLQTAISLLNGNQMNPAQLLGMMNQFDQTGMQQGQQDSAYWQSIIANLAKVFGL